MFNKKNFTILFIIVFSVLFSVSVFALEIDGEDVSSVNAPQCCKLKHSISGWSSGTGGYVAGNFVGVPTDDFSKTCPAFNQATEDYHTDPNWAGYCMLDGIASIGDIVKYSAMVAVGVALLIAAVMFVASAGNPERVGVARKIFYYSFIGIMIATLAHFLPGVVRFFLGI